MGMGYLTSYSLEWEPQAMQPNCLHPKDEDAKFCPECGLPVGLTDVISAYLRENREVYYGINELGNTTEGCSWYDHEEDMLILSREFPTVIFTLHGEGQESGDNWRQYFLNGKSQKVQAKITFDEFDLNKLS